MKIKKLAVSVLTMASLAFVSMGTLATTVDAAVSVQTTSGVVYVTNANGATVYNEPSVDGSINASSNSLADNSAWLIDKTANIDGTTYYEVATNMWLKADDISLNAPSASTQASSTTTEVNKTMYVQAGGSVNMYSAPGDGYYTGRVNGGEGYVVFQEATDANGQVWYDLGQSNWVNGQYMSEEKVSDSVTMTATAYDPAVLGSNMGYSGVAANLSKYPKGTHLRITDSNGNVYDRVVNDTGYFAYSNPNQLDIAMPNSQAMQFGRQTITVQVIG